MSPPHRPATTSTAETTPLSPRPRPPRRASPLVPVALPTEATPPPSFSHIHSGEPSQPSRNHIHSGSPLSLVPATTSTVEVCSPRPRSLVHGGNPLPWAERGCGNAIHTTTTPMPMHRRGEKCNAKQATALKTCRKNGVLPQKGSKDMCPGYPDWRQRLEGDRADEWAAGARCVLLAMKLGKTNPRWPTLPLLYHLQSALQKIC